MVAWSDCDSMQRVFVRTFATSDDYLDFVFGWFPAKLKTVQSREELEGVDPRHIEWKKIKEGDRLASGIRNMRKKRVDGLYVPSVVPVEYEGIKPGDAVAVMVRNPDEEHFKKLKERTVKVKAILYELRDFPPHIPGHFPDPQSYGEEADIRELWICCVQMFRTGGPDFGQGPSSRGWSKRR